MFNFTKITSYYNFLFDELADPRTNDWFLIKDPIPPLSILCLYLYFVTSWGPKYMKNREPWKLTRTLLVYNFIQVIFSTYLFIEGLNKAWLHYNYRCQPVDFSNDPKALKVARLVHFYFLGKMSELLDTVFFVLRKKDNQVTFLHIYHHTVMPMVSWGTTKYFPGGHGTFIGLINSFVHIIMYTYYLLAAMGPGLQKYLWWKRYITTLQLIQFCIAFIHSSQLLFIDCGFPRWSVCFTLPNSIFFYYLFSDFYKMAYDCKNSVQKIDSKITESCDKSDVHKNGKVEINGNHIKFH